MKKMIVMLLLLGCGMIGTHLHAEAIPEEKQKDAEKTLEQLRKTVIVGDFINLTPKEIDDAIRDFAQNTYEKGTVQNLLTGLEKNIALEELEWYNLNEYLTQIAEKKALRTFLARKDSLAALEKSNVGGRNNAKIKIAKSELLKAEAAHQKASALKSAVDVMYETREERKEVVKAEQELEKNGRERERLKKSLESGVGVDKERDKSNIEIQKEKNAAFKADFEKIFAKALKLRMR